MCFLLMCTTGLVWVGKYVLLLLQLSDEDAARRVCALVSNHLQISSYWTYLFFQCGWVAPAAYCFNFILVVACLIPLDDVQNLNGCGLPTVHFNRECQGYLFRAHCSRSSSTAGVWIGLALIQVRSKYVIYYSSMLPTSSGASCWTPCHATQTNLGGTKQVGTIFCTNFRGFHPQIYTPLAAPKREPFCQVACYFFAPT